MVFYIEKVQNTKSNLEFPISEIGTLNLSIQVYFESWTCLAYQESYDPDQDYVLLSLAVGPICHIYF
jgi:hypothetical protein